jgi:hypothetical protein
VFWPPFLSSSSGRTEPRIVVPVVPLIPVAIGDPAIVVIVVPRAAAQNGDRRHTRHKFPFFLRKSVSPQKKISASPK